VHHHHVETPAAAPARAEEDAMIARFAAGVSGLALSLAATTAGAGAPPAGAARDGGTAARVPAAPELDLPPNQPPIAPEAGTGTPPEPAAPPAASPRAVLVQGYVRSATPEQLVLSTPGTTETLTLAIGPATRVLSAGEEDVAVHDLQPGQLVRAALVPEANDLVALVVEVMPGEPDRTLPGAAPPPGFRSGGAKSGTSGAAAPGPPGPSGRSAGPGPSPVQTAPRSVR
jgi:hypothetical protein